MKIYLLSFSDIRKGTRLKFVPNLIRIFIDEYDKEGKTDNFINEINHKNTCVIFGFHIEKLTKQDKDLLQYYSTRLNNIHMLLNDIKKVDIIYDKYLTYKTFENSYFLNVPKFENVNEINKIKMNIKYPIILCSNKSSGGSNMLICDNKKQLLDNFNKLKKEKEKFNDKIHKNDKYFDKILIKEFIESKYKDYNLSIRIYFLNNIILDIRPRPSKNKIIHVYDQEKNINVLRECQQEIYRWFDANKDYVNNIMAEIYNVLGDGFWCTDLLLKDNKIYLCEFEYKYFETTTEKFLNKYNLYFNERTIAKDNHIKIVKEYFKNLEKLSIN